MRLCSIRSWRSIFSCYPSAATALMITAWRQPSNVSPPFFATCLVRSQIRAGGSRPRPARPPTSYRGSLASLQADMAGASYAIQRPTRFAMVVDQFDHDASYVILHATIFCINGEISGNAGGLCRGQCNPRLIAGGSRLFHGGIVGGKRLFFGGPRLIVGGHGGGIRLGIYDARFLGRAACCRSRCGSREGEDRRCEQGAPGIHAPRPRAGAFPAGRSRQVSVHVIPWSRLCRSAMNPRSRPHPPRSRSPAPAHDR